MFTPKSFSLETYCDTTKFRWRYYHLQRLLVSFFLHVLWSLYIIYIFPRKPACHSLTLPFFIIPLNIQYGLRYIASEILARIAFRWSSCWTNARGQVSTTRWKNTPDGTINRGRMIQTCSYTWGTIHPIFCVGRVHQTDYLHFARAVASTTTPIGKFGCWPKTN